MSVDDCALFQLQYVTFILHHHHYPPPPPPPRSWMTRCPPSLNSRVNTTEKRRQKQRITSHVTRHTSHVTRHLPFKFDLA